MSFIPSFILSALIFCNAKISGGWDDASFSEGIICEIPCTNFTLSLEHEADELPALKNAAAIFTFDSLSLKLAAGSLAVSGTGGQDQLSVALPTKDDGRKPISFFVSRDPLSLYCTTGQMLIQFTSGNSGTILQNALSAGWKRIETTKDDSWFLRYPWHPGGNLHTLHDSLSARFSFFGVRLETTAEAGFSLPDMMAPAASGALNLLLKAGSSETAVSVSAAPAHFMTRAGTLTDELFAAKASFTFRESAPQENTEVTYKTDGGFVVKQPAAALELSKNYFNASLSYSLKKGDIAAGLDVNADKFCFDDGCLESVISAAAELSFHETGISLNGKVLPFQDRTSAAAVAPEVTVKVFRDKEPLSLSYTALFSDAELETQTFALTDRHDSTSLSTEIIFKKTDISLNISFSKAW